jgi:predicted amidohydrolase
MHDFHVACGQFAPEPGEKDKNTARMIRYAGEARDLRCDLILFPELVVTGYIAAEEIPPLAEPLDGPHVQQLSKAARDLGIAIAFGLAEKDAETDTCYNSLVALNAQGELAGVYRKMHLWSSEKEWAQGGDRVETFSIGEMTCGGWICYDTRFPEVARLVALRGADLGLVPTAWLGPADEWALALRARALDNAMFVAGADIISYDPMLRCYGHSMIVDPHGEVLARAEPEEAGIIHAKLEAEVLEAQRARVPLLADRHPELYADLHT